MSEFSPELYSYQTRSDDNPRNLVVMCNAQGSHVQQDRRGNQRVLLHKVDAAGRVTENWMRAAASRFRVGDVQEQTDEERADAARSNVAHARVLGIRAMGTRLNALMTVQVPIRQRPERVTRGMPAMAMAMGAAPVMRSAAPASRTASSYAASISVGSEVGSYRGLTKRDPEREPTQPITITVVLYYVTPGGVPSAEDVTRAVHELDHLYESCSWSGTLSKAGAPFTTSTPYTVPPAATTTSLPYARLPPPPPRVPFSSTFPSVGDA